MAAVDREARRVAVSGRPVINHIPIGLIGHIRPMGFRAFLTFAARSPARITALRHYNPDSNFTSEPAGLSFPSGAVPKTATYSTPDLSKANAVGLSRLAIFAAVTSSPEMSRRKRPPAFGSLHE